MLADPAKGKKEDASKKFTEVQALKQDITGADPTEWPKADGHQAERYKKMLDKYQKFSEEASEDIGAKSHNHFSSAGLCDQKHICVTITNASIAQLEPAQGKKPKAVGKKQMAALLNHVSTQKTITLNKEIHKGFLHRGKQKVEGVVARFTAPKKEIKPEVLAGYLFDAWKLMALEKEPTAIRAVRAQTDGQPIELMSFCLYPEGFKKKQVKNFCLGIDSAIKVPKKDSKDEKKSAKTDETKDDKKDDQKEDKKERSKREAQEDLEAKIAQHYSAQRGHRNQVGASRKSGTQRLRAGAMGPKTRISGMNRISQFKAMAQRPEDVRIRPRMDTLHQKRFSEPSKPGVASKQPYDSNPQVMAVKPHTDPVKRSKKGVGKSLGCAVGSFIPGIDVAVDAACIASSILPNPLKHHHKHHKHPKREALAMAEARAGADPALVLSAVKGVKGFFTKHGSDMVTTGIETTGNIGGNVASSKLAPQAQQSAHRRDAGLMTYLGRQKDRLPKLFNHFHHRPFTSGLSHGRSVSMPRDIARLDMIKRRLAEKYLLYRDTNVVGKRHAKQRHRKHRHGKNRYGKNRHAKQVVDTSGSGQSEHGPLKQAGLAQMSASQQQTLPELQKNLDTGSFSSGRNIAGREAKEE